MPSVSVVLATYNGDAFLERQLQSLAWQTRLPDELVVGDDCSTDQTVAFLEKFAARAPFPVRITVNKEQLNFRRNFYETVSRSHGDLIMFCDQDDIWRPRKIATMVERFAGDEQLMLAYHHATVVDADERVIGPISDPLNERQSAAALLPSPWHFARGLLQTFRRELTRFDDLKVLSKEHFSEDILGHDRWYIMLAHALGAVAYVDADLLLYRQHGNNAFGADDRLGVAAQLLRRIVHEPITDMTQARGARSRALVLTRAAERYTGTKRRRMLHMARAYEEFAARLERRKSTYCLHPRHARVRSLASAVRAGDYRGNPWGFDVKSLPRDLWYAVGGQYT